MIIRNKQGLSRFLARNTDGKKESKFVLETNTQPSPAGARIITVTQQSNNQKIYGLEITPLRISIQNENEFDGYITDYSYIDINTPIKKIILLTITIIDNQYTKSIESKTQIVDSEEIPETFIKKDEHKEQTFSIKDLKEINIPLFEIYSPISSAFFTQQDPPIELSDDMLENFASMAISTFGKWAILSNDRQFLLIKKLWQNVKIIESSNSPILIYE